MSQDLAETISSLFGGSLLAGEMFIDVDMIKCAILHLPNKLAAGIDGISAILLNNYANSLSVPDHILW